MSFIDMTSAGYSMTHTQTHIPIHQKLLSLSPIETNEKSIMLCFLNQKMLLKVQYVMSF